MLNIHEPGTYLLLYTYIMKDGSHNTGISTYEIESIVRVWTPYIAVGDEKRWKQMQWTDCSSGMSNGYIVGHICVCAAARESDCSLILYKTNIG